MTSPAFPGYLTLLKTALTLAIQRVFDAEYPDADFRSLHCSIEYPLEPAHYPGIWVDYDDTDQLQIAGIAHKEYSEPGVDGSVRQFTRWRFTGVATYTVVALSSLERDRLYDALVSLIAFGQEQPQTAEFRAYVSNNPHIAMQFDWDQIRPTGNAAAQGTPWGSDDVIYERSINMEVIGEFVSDGRTGTLVPLSEIRVEGFDLHQGPAPASPSEEGWQ